MIFNFVFNFKSKNIDRNSDRYLFNGEFLKWVATEFAEDHLMDFADVYHQINASDELLAHIERWLKESKGFKTCKVWQIRKDSSNKEYLGRGFDISDDDPGFIKWKLSRE